MISSHATHCASFSMASSTRAAAEEQAPPHPRARDTVLLYASIWVVAVVIGWSAFAHFSPGAVAKGAKVLLALALAPFLIAVLDAGQAAPPAPSAPVGALSRPFLDERDGTLAARANAACDLYWLRLHPSGAPPLHAREATTARPLGSYSPVSPVKHEEDDQPRHRGWPSWARHVTATASALAWESLSFGQRKDYGARYGKRTAGLGAY